VLTAELFSREEFPFVSAWLLLRTSLFLSQLVAKKIFELKKTALSCVPFLQSKAMMAGWLFLQPL